MLRTMKTKTILAYTVALSGLVASVPVWADDTPGETSGTQRKPQRTAQKARADNRDVLGRKQCHRVTIPSYNARGVC